MKSYAQRYQELPAATSDVVPDRARATINLLANMLRGYIDPNITGHCGDGDCEECNGQADLLHVLTRVREEYGK